MRRLDNAGPTSNSLAVYYKVAIAGEPASYAWGVSGASFAVGGVQGFTGIDTASPIDVENGQSTPSATTHAAPAVTSTVANAMLVASHAFASSRTWTQPSGMTESFDRPSGANSATGLSVDGSRVLMAAAGSSGTKTATAAGNADAGNAHLLALRPASANLSIATPAGTTLGDVMIAAIGFNNSGAAITPPSGWTLVRRMNNSSTTSNSLAIYRRTAIAGEPSSHIWGVAGGAFLVGGIQSFSGVDGANPIDAESGQSTPSSTNHDTPSITTSTANTMLVTSHTFASSRSWTAQAGLTESFERLSGSASAIGQSITGTRQAQATAGASGTKRSTAASSADVGNTHILALRQVQVQVQAQALHFIHVDHLNTPRLVTNAAQQAVWRWDQQEPFGVNAPDENPSGLGAFEFRLRFPGQYADKETNLHYNYFRDYDPNLGRYSQSDLIGLAGGINLYAYVDNNPISKTDPLGLQAIPAPGGGLGGFGGIGGFGGRGMGGQSSGGTGSRELDEAMGMGGSRSSSAPGTGSGSSSNNCPPDDDDKCEKQRIRDENMCRMTTMPGTGARSRCWQSVTERYGACRAGKPLPPLVMW